MDGKECVVTLVLFEFSTEITNEIVCATKVAYLMKRLLSLIRMGNKSFIFFSEPLRIGGKRVQTKLIEKERISH